MNLDSTYNYVADTPNLKRRKRFINQVVEEGWIKAYLDAGGDFWAPY